MTSPPRLRFPRRQRLRHREDFQRVFAGRYRTGDANVLVYARPNGLEYARLGLVVSRRLGNAVVRNLIKRRLREAFRANRHDLPADLDVICIPRPGPPKSMQSYAASLRRLLPTLRRRILETEENE